MGNKNTFTGPESQANNKLIKDFDVEKLFKTNTENLTDFEKLPKNIHSTICEYLEINEISKLFLLNKFFLNLLANSNCATIVWKYKTECYLNQIGLGDLNVEEYCQDLILDPYEKKLNKYYIFMKHHNFFEKWSKNVGNATVLSPDQRTYSNGINFILAS